MNKHTLNRIVPITHWLPSYRRAYLSGDLTAGLTVAVMLIPQGMAYAMIAGLPPVYGLYASLVPPLVYGVFGTSRQLSVGPVAMDSILVAAGVSALATIGTEYYIILAITLALIMGLVQLVFGLLKLGFLVNFLSKPVISGFTSAAAFIIGFSQLQHVIGVDLGRHSNVFFLMREAVQQFEDVNWISVMITGFGILVMRLSKKVHKKIPGALMAVLLGIVFVKFGGLEHKGVHVIGSIPAGLPSFTIPQLSYAILVDLLPIATTLALIAFMEAIAIAKSLQGKHRGEYALDNNQEMISLGLGNVIGSFFGSYPTTGSFGRSAVNDQSGAKTNLATIISAALVGLILLFLTPVFYHLPKAMLSAVIIVAVFGLVDVSYPKFLFKVSKQDFFMLLITFVITLVLGIREGIAAGVLVSLLMLIYRTTHPHMVVLGKVPETKDYRNVDRFEDIDEREDVLILRHDAQLYFANMDRFIEVVKGEVERKGKGLKLLIFHFASVSSVDATALQGLRELIQDLNERQIGVYFSGLTGPVRDFFHQTKFIEEVGENHFFIDIQPAIDYLDHGARKRNKQMLKRALQTNIFKEQDV